MRELLNLRGSDLEKIREKIRGDEALICLVHPWFLGFDASEQELGIEAARSYLSGVGYCQFDTTIGQEVEAQTAYHEVRASRIRETRQLVGILFEESSRARESLGHLWDENADMEWLVVKTLSGCVRLDDQRTYGGVAEAISRLGAKELVVFGSTDGHRYACVPTVANELIAGNLRQRVEIDHGASFAFLG